MEGVLDLALSDSDPSLSSTSKRKRAKKGTACTACRVKKRRCDGGKPSCTPCIRDSEPVCVYTVLKLRARTAILQDKVNQLEAQVTLLESAFNAADIGLDASTIFARITGRSAHSGASERSLSTASLKTQSKELLCQLQTQLQSSASSPLGSWWNTDEEPPSGLVAILANRFAKYEHQFTHDLLPAEFYESLRDPDPDTGPHPGLRNVIFLIACHYSPGPLSILESVFLRRARSHLSESLARTDRLLDYVEAQTLLGTYYINKGSWVQGVRNTAATMMLAVACGLHALSPSNWLPENSPCLLPAPRSDDEIRRRIRVWWIIYTRNRLGSAANSVPSEFADEGVDTLWELPLDANSSEIQPAQCPTISSLYVDESKASYVYNDTANVIRSKCAALVGRAHQFGCMAAKMSKDDTDYWNKFWEIDKAIQQVTRSLPSMFEEPRFEFDAPHVVSKGVDRKTNEFIIVPHLLVCDAVIYLHHRLARAGNVASREACLKAAWRAMPVIRQVLDQNMGRSVFTYLTVTWLHIFQEFGCEYDRLQALQDLKRADVILRELKTLSRVLHEQSEYSPLARAMLSDLRIMFPSLRDQPGIF